MENLVKFLSDCSVYYVATIKNGRPAVRPFGVVMNDGVNIYIATGSGKNVYKQLCENQSIQIVALKDGTREWVRIDGDAIECKDKRFKKEMLESYPVLQNHYTSENDMNFAVFKITVLNYELN